MAKKKERSEQEQIEYQVNKLKYHAYKLHGLGVSLDFAFKESSLIPEYLGEDWLTNDGQLFSYPDVQNAFRGATWRFKFVDDQSSTIQYRLGPYKNNYMRVGEKRLHAFMQDFLIKPFGFQEVGIDPCFNNAMYYEVYEAKLPVPREELEKAIELLKMKTDDPEFEARCEQGFGILSNYFN